MMPTLLGTVCGSRKDTSSTRSDEALVRVERQGARA